MSEKNSNYSYRGGLGLTNPGRRDGGGSRTLIIFLIVSAVFILGVYGLYRASRKRTDSGKADGTASEVQPDEGKLQTEDTVSRPVRQPISEELKKAEPELSRLCEDAEQNLSQGEPVEAAVKARELLSAGLPEDHPLWVKAAEILSRANTELLFSDIPLPERKVLYTVKRGDALVKIANNFNTTVAAIQKANRMDPGNVNIRIGQTLSIYKANWSIEVKKKLFRLYLYEDEGRLFKVYRVGIGRQGRTPTGSFKIKNKIIEPDWDSPKGRIPYGAEGHELGTRWMGFTPTGETDPNLSGYGIHGTWEPDTIGMESSNGCIRMRNEDVNELFDIVPRQTTVNIVD